MLRWTMLGFGLGGCAGSAPTASDSADTAPCEVSVAEVTVDTPVLEGRSAAEVLGDYATQADVSPVWFDDEARTLSVSFNLDPAAVVLQVTVTGDDPSCIVPADVRVPLSVQLQTPDGLLDETLPFEWQLPAQTLEAEIAVDASALSGNLALTDELQARAKAPLDRYALTVTAQVDADGAHSGTLVGIGQTDATGPDGSTDVQFDVALYGVAR